MRLLHVISSADPRGGGPIEGIRQLAAAHARLGHHTELASLDAPHDVPADAFDFPVHRLGPSLTHYKYSPRFLPWLRAHARSFDAVIVNGLWQYASFAAWRACRETATPYFVFPHGMLDPWFKRTYPAKHLKKWLFWPWSDYRVLRDARAVLFTCEEERRLARESFWLYRCNEAVVSLGTAAPPQDADAQRALFLARFPEIFGKRIVLFLSRLHEKKACDLVLRAFARAAATRPELHLVMAGPEQPQYGARLRELAAALGIAPRITWTGMLSGAYKWGAYRSAEVFLLPSHQENFGIVVAEALACGVPVLISDKVNIWREVAQDGAGFVANDDEAGASALLERWLALTPEGRAAAAENARQCFARRYEITAAAQALIEAIRSTPPGAAPAVPFARHRAW